MLSHVRDSGMTGSRVGGIRAEFNAVVVECVLTTLLEGKIALMCDSRGEQVGAPLGRGWN